MSGKLRTDIDSVVSYLREAIEDKENVVIEGAHGTGKTTIIKNLFDKHYGEGNWVYFSGSTMDPFLDFIGCPTKQTDETGTEFLGMVRPERFAKDRVRAIFIDEFNRTTKHVRNAVMELLQFKEINGQKFNNLEVIWTAINPADDEYDCEALDPAQHDRFHVHLTIADAPCLKYLEKRYGKSVARGAKEWWKQLPKDIRKTVSPRRLDYALEGFLKKGRSLQKYLDSNTNPQKLANDIKTGPTVDELKKISGDRVKMREFFKDENNFSSTRDFTMRPENVSTYLPHFPIEKQSVELNNIDLSDFISKMLFSEDTKENKETRKEIVSLIKEIHKSGVNEEFNRKLEEGNLMSTLDALISNT